MSERAPLKSEGRFICNGQEMYFELELTPKQYLIRYFNQQGNLKVIRPIQFPTEGVEIHHIDNYLLGYLHNFKDTNHSQVFLVKLDTFRVKELNCYLNLQCKTEQNTAICQLYHNRTMGAIIFSDLDNKLYLMRVGDGDVKCIKIHQNDKVITRIGMDQQKNIVLTSQDLIVTVLEINWEKDILIGSKVRKNQADYFYQNGFEVVFVDNNPQQQNFKKGSHKNDDVEYELQIRSNQNMYRYSLKKSEKLIFYSKNKASLFVFCPRIHLLICLVDGIFSIYLGRQMGKQIPKNLGHSNFMVSYEKDDYRNLRITLRLYEITGTFKTEIFEIPQLEKSENISFLQQSIENIFTLNGLINPVHEPFVIEVLNDIKQMKESFEESRVANTDNSLELATKLFRKCLSVGQIPKSMLKIPQKLKMHIMNDKQTSYILETKRFFDHANKILFDVVSELEQVFQNIKKKSQSKSSISSSQESVQNIRLKQILQLLENMINFLFMMIIQLQAEQQNMKLDEIALQSKRSETVYQKQMNLNREVLNGTKSLFLIGNILNNKQIFVRYSEYLEDLDKKQLQIMDYWREKHPKLVQMQYPPCMLHEHFESYSQLITVNDRPVLDDFISYLLQNRNNFLQIAYFYQAITKSRSVPFLETDTVDLITHILANISPLPELTPEQQDEHLSETLLHKMAGTVVQVKYYPFLKYLIQLSVYYKQYALASMLIEQIAPSSIKELTFVEDQHSFIIKSFILCGKVDLAYLYVLKNHTDQTYDAFLQWVKTSGNLKELIRLKLEKKMLKEDEELMASRLDLSPQKQQSFDSLLNKLEKMSDC